MKSPFPDLSIAAISHPVSQPVMLWHKNSRDFGSVADVTHESKPMLATTGWSRASRQNEPALIISTYRDNPFCRWETDGGALAPQP